MLFRSSEDNSMVTGSDYEDMIARIAEMGFEREQIVIALEASFNNPNRAIEYLMDPVLLQRAHAQLQAQQAAPAAAAASQPQASPGSAPAAAPGGASDAAAPAPNANSGNLFEQAAAAQAESRPGGGSAAFEQLRQLPNFDAIRQLIQQQPQLLQHVLQNLSQANPQLYQLIVQNQAEFIQLLNEPVPEGTPSLAEGLGGEGGEIGRASCRERV